MVNLAFHKLGLFSNTMFSRVFRPGIYPRNMKLDSKTASFYYSRPSEWLDGRRAVVPCAHILGGGSSINFMVGSFMIRDYTGGFPY